ncbi:MAG: hypothetical protein ABI181_13060 [Mycobacteriaceae bacterium]
MSGPVEEVLDAARSALQGYVDVTTDDDGSLSFLHSGVPCAVQAVELAPGLVVLSMTCVLGWDLAPGPDLDAQVARLGSLVQFGGLGVVQRDTTADVTLRYAFPAAGLAADALATLLLLVVSGAGRTATQLGGGHG